MKKTLLFAILFAFILRIESMKRLLSAILFFLLWACLPCFAAEPIQLARMNPWVAGSSGGASSPITFDAASTKAGSSTSTLTVSHTVTGSNRVLIVVTISSGGNDCTGITYGGVALTAISGWAGCATGITACQQGWYLVAPATGANNIVATFGATETTVRMVATSWNGVHQTTPLGTAAFSSAYSATPSATVTTVSGDMVVDAARASNEVTADASQALRVTSEGSVLFRSSSEQATSTSTVMSWTTASGWWTVGAVGLKRANP